MSEEGVRTSGGHGNRRVVIIVQVGSRIILTGGRIELGVGRRVVFIRLGHDWAVEGGRCVGRDNISAGVCVDVRR